MGKFPYIFFMFYIVSHTIFVFLIHARPFITTWKNCNVSMQCIFMLFFMLCMRWESGALTLPKVFLSSPTHIQTMNSLTKTHALELPEAKYFHSHLDILVLVGLSFKAVLLLRLFIILRGSNNKHLLLKCINCNKNKNNNKLKQLQSRRREKGENSEIAKEREKTAKINYLRNIQLKKFVLDVNCF